MGKEQVLIIGAGISGLSLSVNLKISGVPFRIIEKKANWNRKGLAMVIQGEGLKAASSMGILNELESQGKKRQLQRIEDGSGRILKRLNTNLPDPGFIIRRDILHKSLRTRVPELEMDLHPSGFTETDTGVDVEFSDGSTDSFGLVIGADGINSETRTLINGIEDSVSSDKAVSYSGAVIWGMAVDQKYKDIIEIWDKNRMYAMYPITGGTVFSFIYRTARTFSSRPEERAEHIRKYFSSLPQQVIRDALTDLPQEIFFGHIRYTRPKIWNKGRFTLIGDACHSMSPLSGMGANLAMADAAGLAEFISRNAGRKDSLTWLTDFNKKRMSEAGKYYTISKVRTRRSLTGQPGSWIRNKRMRRLDWVY